MNTKPILALDFPGEAEVFNFLKHFNESLFVKIGMELYMQEGPDIVRKVKNLGHDIFLDLKLHDIPNTVGSAMKGLAPRRWRWRWRFRWRWVATRIP